MTNLNLKEAISQLETQQILEKRLLQTQLQLTYESISPINLFKTTISQVTQSPEIRGNLTNMVMGLAAGYVSEMLFERISTNPFKKVLGSVLLFGITNLVAKNPEKVKSIGRVAYRLFKGEAEDEAPL